MAKRVNKIKHKSTRDEDDDYPSRPDLYERAQLAIKALKGSWEVKKGKVIIKRDKKKKKGKGYDLR